MRKILLLIFCCSFLFAEAQERTVNGRVTSAEDGATLPGVNVLLKGTASGTVTDANGNYRLVIPDGGGTLVFSFIGFRSLEIPAGERTTVDASLVPDVTQLSEVVVTALGVERQSRELGYGLSGVKSEDLTVSREANILNALQGKVTGVTITQSSGNLGGSTKIIIRGVSSLSGRNNPLWVVDGVPINDAQDNTTSRITGNRDFAGGSAVINPDDVESINVLKGAAATALYGSRAAAGVIVVTTKKGKRGQGRATVTVNSSVRFDNLFRVPEYQNEYAGGANFKYDSTATANNWGPRIVGQQVTELGTGNRVALQAYKDNYKDFYRTGRTLINNIAFADGNEKGDYRLSVTSLNQVGILPNAELDRLTTSFNAGMKHSDKLRTRFGIQYISTQSQGTGVAGANDPNVFNLDGFVRSTNFKNFKPWIDENGNQLGFASPFDNNPFWLQHENKNEREDERFLGNFETIYSPIQELSFTARLGYDFDQDNRLITNRVGTRSRATGDFTIDKINRKQLNVDLIATYFKTFGSDYNLKMLGGFNYNKRGFSAETLFSQNLSIPELFNPSNALSNVPTRGFAEQTLFGAYGEASLSYKDWATLSVTGRNDWSSTLPADNRSYFYPSASLALVITDALGMKSKILNYGKLRASVAQVGNDTNPYQLDFNFIPAAVATGQYSLNQNFPFNGRLGFVAQNRIPPINLKPERQTTIEFGAELQFLNSRITLDVSYFSSSNKDQILAIPIPQSTGFATQTINVGEVVQEGVEISLDAKVIDGKNFKWNSIVNFTHNESTVKSLAQGTERILIASEFNNIQVVAVPGREFQLFTTTYLSDPVSGRPIINPANGLRQSGPVATRGSVMPDFTMGFINAFSYKGFTLSTTIDWRSGGLIHSATVAALWASGATAETAVNREGTFIDTHGVLANGDGTFRENDIPVRSAQTFWNNLAPSGAADATIFDASFAKLRELGLSYTVPSHILGTRFIRQLQVGVEGRNIALLYAKVPHIDPEANLFGAGVDGFGVERAAVPSTRSIGFNVRLTF
ncbi:MAG: SusC/RagA family TonB-linked outer membrane protein [Cyclobacteriaceae bacterium]|nr:SusC/RagA family TonB-linked outer membrane protein [Cyclobacteriaceae bacterium]